VRSSQLILVAFCAAITAGLFFFGNTKTPPKSSSDEITGINSSRTVSLSDSIVLFKDKLETPEMAELQGLEANLEEHSTGSAAHNETLLAMAHFWEKQQALPPSSYYFTEYAKATDEAISWKEASKRNYLAFQAANDTLWKPYFAEEAVVSLEKTLSFAPSDLESKIQLAECLIEGKNEVMQGVLLLREVTEAEPNNIPANMQLGRLSIMSGQFEKAKERFRTILAVEPNNTEALYFLGDTHVALKEKEEAIAAFKKCRELVDSPLFKQKLDEYVNKRKRHKIATHKRKKRLRKNRHKTKK